MSQTSKYVERTTQLMDMLTDSIRGASLAYLRRMFTTKTHFANTHFYRMFLMDPWKTAVSLEKLGVHIYAYEGQNPFEEHGYEVPEVFKKMFQEVPYAKFHVGMRHDEVLRGQHILLSVPINVDTMKEVVLHRDFDKRVPSRFLRAVSRRIRKMTLKKYRRYENHEVF